MAFAVFKVSFSTLLFLCLSIAKSNRGEALTTFSIHLGVNVQSYLSDSFDNKLDIDGKRSRSLPFEYSCCFLESTSR